MRKKNEEYEENQITKYTFLVLNHILLKNILRKKSCFVPLYHQIVFTVFMRYRIFETHYWYTIAQYP